TNPGSMEVPMPTPSAAPVPTNGAPVPMNGAPVPANGAPVPTNGAPVPTNGASKNPAGQSSTAGQKSDRRAALLPRASSAPAPRRCRGGSAAQVRKVGSQPAVRTPAALDPVYNAIMLLSLAKAVARTPLRAARAAWRLGRAATRFAQALGVRV